MITLDPQLKWLLRMEPAAVLSLARGERFGLYIEDRKPAARVLVQYNGESEDVEALGFRVVSVATPVLSGTISLNELKKLQPSSHVQYVEAARGLKSELDLSVPATGAHLLHAERPRVRGRGVLVGIVDTGIDYTLPVFKRRDGSTRILAIWDQGLVPRRDERSPKPFCYGVEARKGEIDRALTSRDPFGQVRHRDLADGHGTYVAGIAAGRGAAGVGVAPEAELLVVSCRGESGSLADSARVLDAVAWIFGIAEELEMPVVVNLSSGDQLGAHDGTALLEKGLDSLLRRTGRAVVKSAGNAADSGTHAGGQVPPAGELRLRFHVPAEAATEDLIDLWYEPEDRLAVRLVSPRGEGSPWVPAGASAMESELPNQNQVFMDSVVNHPSNGANRVAIFLGPGGADTIEAGEWTLVVRGDRVSRGTVDVWIQGAGWTGTAFLERDAGADSTVSIPGTSRMVIAVGSHVTRAQEDAGRGDESGRLSRFSGRGPTRDGRLKPEITAPGEWIASARSGSAKTDHTLDEEHGRLKRGTSLAAAHVTGAVALLLSRHRDASVRELREALAHGGLADAATGLVPNNTWGAGKLNIDAARRWLDGIRRPTATRKRRKTKKG